ncbi:MAG: hypothetical protein QM780_16735 [Hyphomicrobium sp.]|uniref:hypothetical protein n=1 Tax=Hyphomicrobium sp. TaxID=82 RepID=UPI0039E672DD
MLRQVIPALLTAAGSISGGFAHAETACLPAALFPPEQEAAPPVLDLGLVAGVPTLCALNDTTTAGMTGCWTIDTATGALTTASVTALPGHSHRGKTDADGCIEGFCPAPQASPDEVLLWATSTDGTHAAILRENVLSIFDTVSKAQTVTIALSDDNAPEKTNVGNEPMEILYVGHSIFIVGADAGPFTGVWAFKDDGTRLGIIDPKAHKTTSGHFSVYAGGVNVIDDNHVALADAGLQSVLIVDARDGSIEEFARPVSTAPCTPDEVNDGLDLGNIEVAEPGSPIGVSQACHDTIVKNFSPYFDLDPVRLPSGDFLAALSGAGRGTLATLDGKTLAEKNRLQLAKCLN